MQRLSLASPPALSGPSKRCVGLTPFREEKEPHTPHAQQAWLQVTPTRTLALALTPTLTS